MEVDFMVDKKYVNELKSLYLNEIYECLDFWLKNGVDMKYGGFLSSLDREGKVYGTDKAVWIQGRGVYTFSKAYNEIEKRGEWLEAARLGYEFLKAHCYDTDRRMFFIVTRDGRPVQKRRYYFSETFAVVGCAEYYKATGDAEALALARETFDTLIYLYENPEVLPPKYNPDVIKSKALAVPMILTITAQVLRDADPDNAEMYNKLIDRFIREILNDFLKPEKKALFETVGVNGERIDSPAGRTINPGHCIEASWFLLSEGMRNNDKALVSRSLDIMNWAFDLGWDCEYGGFLYFIDIDGRPSEKLEWDMKLWWGLSEALIAFLMAFKATGDEFYWNRFIQMQEYMFSHFRDREFGEWYGYLHRDGSVSNDLKGNLFKGPFHMPRALILCYQMLADLI